MGDDRVDRLGAAIPFLRRYARSLTGSPMTGDLYGAAALEAALDDDLLRIKGESIKITLFRAFHVVWISAGAPVEDADPLPGCIWKNRMSKLTPNAREALLLHITEGFGFLEIASILMVDADEARQSVHIALQKVRVPLHGRVRDPQSELISTADHPGIFEEPMPPMPVNAEIRIQE